MPSLLALLLSLPAALANGQTTHVWISRAAVDVLPPGELSNLLSNPAHDPMLVHGTMFPDGGYPLGHPYGESAHWEPLQTRYLDWIRTEFELPYGQDAAPHIAFLMGLGSHGLADQTFDAFYLDRSQRYDAELGWADGLSMDEATDFKWAALRGAQTVPDRWLPDEVLVELFAQEGIEVDPETLHQGQDLLELAIGLVGISATTGGDLERYEAAFPWATSNLENSYLPGIPDYETEVIASYWQVLWERLHHRSAPTLIDRTWPVDGGYGLSPDADSPDARISVIFHEGLLRDDLDPGLFTVEDDGGTEYPVDVWLYYGDNSHIVHLVPQTDWPDDAWLTVTLGAGLPTRTGAILDTDHRFRVSTLPPPVDTGAPPAQAAEPADSPKRRCGCTVDRGLTPLAPWLGLFLPGFVFLRRRVPPRESP